MKTYKVILYWQDEVEVKAKSKEEALEKARWDTQEPMLDRVELK